MIVVVQRSLKSLTIKIAGKAATKIGGRFIPGTGWVLSGIDL